MTDEVLGKLVPGDHVWAFKVPQQAPPGAKGRAPDKDRYSTAGDVPRMRWFPDALNDGSKDAQSDYSGYGASIFQYVIHADHVRIGSPQMRAGPGTFAWLNNNPGNLTAKPGGDEFGGYAGKRNYHNFIIFSTIDAGWDAIPRFLDRDIFRSKTLYGAMAEYSPPWDGGKPGEYADAIAARLNKDIPEGGEQISRETPFKNLTFDQLKAARDAILQKEGTIKGETKAWNDPSVPAPIRKALGVG
jgi:hypothetical protein